MLLFDSESHGLFKNKMYTNQSNEQLVCFGLEKLVYMYNDEYFVKNRLQTGFMIFFQVAMKNFPSFIHFYERKKSCLCQR